MTKFSNPTLFTISKLRSTLRWTKLGKEKTGHHWFRNCQHYQGRSNPHIINTAPAKLHRAAAMSTPCHANTMKHIPCQHHEAHAMPTPWRTSHTNTMQHQSWQCHAAPVMTIQYSTSNTKIMQLQSCECHAAPVSLILGSRSCTNTMQIQQCQPIQQQPFRPHSPYKVIPTPYRTSSANPMQN